MERETLENGTVLRVMVKTLHAETTKENYINTLRILRDSYVWIPCNLEMDASDLDKFRRAKKGDVVEIDQPARMVPDLLQYGDELYMPVFSNPEQMGEEYSSHFNGILEKHFIEAMVLAQAREDVLGIVLDPFTAPLPIERENFEAIGNLPTLIDDEK